MFAEQMTQWRAEVALFVN